MKGRINKKIFLYMFGIFLLINTVFMVHLVTVQIQEYRLIKQDITGEQMQLLAYAKESTAQNLNAVISDTLYIDNTLALTEKQKLDAQATVSQWIVFSDQKKIYEHIRFINTVGDEKLKITYAENGAYLVPQNELQNKSNELYFQQAIQCADNIVYLSELTLDIINGSTMGYQPIIRASKPYINADGETLGIIVLNFHAQSLFDDMKNRYSSNDSHIILVSTGGDLLLHRDNHSDSQSDTTMQKNLVSFQKQFPEEWNIIQKSADTSFYTDNGIFSFLLVDIADELNKTQMHSLSIDHREKYYIISYIQPDSEVHNIFQANILSHINNIFTAHKLNYVIILIVAGIIAVLFGQRHIKQNTIKFFSEYDQHTMVLNRRAGLKKAKDIISGLNNYNTVSVVFIDINGLKTVNDTLGHTAGDELILSVVNGIKSSIHSSDIVMRMGGDEFLLILPHKKNIDIEFIWDRIKSYYDTINEKENRAYVISAAHGISFPYNKNTTLDDMINDADKKMYAEKKIIKQYVKILR